MYLNEHEKTSEKSHISFALIPIIVIVTIIPLIVRLHVFDPGLEKYPWYSVSNNVALDFFLYYKSVWLIIMLIIMLIILLTHLLRNKKEMIFSRFFVPLFCYGFFIILSTILSIDKEYSIHGITEQFESVGVLLSYITTAYYTFVMVDTEDKLKILLKFWVLMLGLLCVLGLFQFIGYDFIFSDIGKKLIVPSAYNSVRDSMTSAFGKHRVYLSLYNPNYVGMLATLTVPIFSILLIFAKKWKYRILYVCIILGLMISVVGSQSKNAIIVIIPVLVLECIFLRKIFIKYWKKFSIILVSVVLVCIIADGITGFSYSKSMLALFNNSEQVPTLSAIETNDENVTITYKNKKMILSYDINNNELKLNAVNQDGTTIDYQYSTEQQSYSFITEPYNEITLHLGNINDKFSLVLVNGEKQWPISKEFSDETYRLCNSLGKWDKVHPSKSIDLFSENSFSGRGYLWNRTIPLLKNYIVAGSGPDTFALVYPQQDYVTKYNYGYDATITTKPHNMYLQIGVQTGVLSVLAFIAYFILYAFKSIKLYWNNKFSDFYSVIGFAIFVGTLGYIISGITNDSCVAVAPMFWVLTGLGIRVNHQNSKNLIQDL